MGPPSAGGGETAADEPAAEAEPVAAKAETDAAIKLPPGFRPRKRGPFTLYCRKESRVGTRFAVETCYDGRGIREYWQAQRENREKLDQMRRICGSMDACGAG
jgi:hypothetical protein